MSNILFHLNCPNCGKGISDTDTLCPHCGLNLDAPLEKPELQKLGQPYLEKAKKTLETGQNLRGALSDCDTAIEYMPEFAEAHNLRGLLLDMMDKPDQAILAYRQAVWLDPAFTDAKENLANIEAEYSNMAESSSQRQNRLGRRLVIGFIAGISLFALIGLTILLYVFARPLLTPKHEVIFEPDRSRVSTVTPDDLNKTVEILKKRWEILGYGGNWVSFTISDQGQIIAQIPNDVSAEVINRTKVLGLVEFVDVGKTELLVGASLKTDVSADLFPQVTQGNWHTIMTNSEVSTAIPSSNTGGDYVVDFVLTNHGTQIFADYTTRHVGDYLCITLDKVVMSCPRISGAITNGEGNITGNFTKESAQDLATLLQTSPLPIPLK